MTGIIFRSSINTNVGLFRHDETEQIIGRRIACNLSLFNIHRIAIDVSIADLMRRAGL
jgi:hypothetical protein